MRVYDLHHADVAAALAHLCSYFELESDIMEGRIEPSAELIERTCAIRCSGATLLLRIGCRLVGLDYDEHLFTLIRHVSGHDEISTDLPSYEQDLAEGQFNVYRLATWVWGPSTARQHLQGVSDAMIAALHRDIRTAARRTLLLFASFLPAIAPLDPRRPSMVPRLLPQPLLAALVSARVTFHHRAKPLRFPDALPDQAPRPWPSGGGIVLSATGRLVPVAE